MTVKQARVKRGMYVDSVALMQVARTLQALEGIEEAAALMATPTNLEALAEIDLAPFTGVSGELGVNDLLIVVRAADEAHAESALNEAEARLPGSAQTRSPFPLTTEARLVRQPRSLEEAAQRRPQASIAVISVPGMYAALEAQQALLAGLHVFLFSDNVSLEHEVALKRLARERGLLLMGPDCGTARLNGIGLGFVNAVDDGPVGIVSASGTGMQQVMSLLAQAGHGISQAIGCGGRDLSAEVGGLTTLQGLRILQGDEQTRVIVLISKPPDPTVAEQVLNEVVSGTKPIVVIFLGADSAAWQGKYGAHVHFARTLAEAAHMAADLCIVDAIDQPVTTHDSSNQPSGAPAPQRVESAHANRPLYLAALFSGGTLCDEALHIWGEQLGPVYSNIPLNPIWRWQGASTRPGHYALDLGADEYTRGRPHPMIDPEARLQALYAAATNPQVGVILLDIVLGYCSHPDPAAIYAPVIQTTLEQANQAGRHLNYVISLCGTEDDPQQLSRQQSRLRAVGAEVYTSNAEAALHCMELLAQNTE